MFNQLLGSLESYAIEHSLSYLSNHGCRIVARIYYHKYVQILINLIQAYGVISIIL
jgi:hypothetical protein